MLAAPIRRGAVLAGKLLTSLALGVISMGVLALTTHFLLDAHWGDPLGVAILIGAGVVAATAVMALVVTFRAHAGPGRGLARWANDAFSKLIEHGGDLAAVLLQVSADRLRHRRPRRRHLYLGRRLTVA